MRAASPAASSSAAGSPPKSVMPDLPPDGTNASASATRSTVRASLVTDGESPARRLVELALTATTVAGLLLFLPTRVALGAYYGRFGLTPEEAGVNYIDAVTAIGIIIAVAASAAAVATWLAVFLLAIVPHLKKPARAVDLATDAYLALFDPPVALKVAAAGTAAAGVLTALSVGAALVGIDDVARVIAGGAGASGLVVALGICFASVGAVARAVAQFVSGLWSGEEPTAEQRSMQVLSVVAGVGFLLVAAGLLGYWAGGRVRDGQPTPTKLLGLRLPYHADLVKLGEGKASACEVYLGTKAGHVVTWNPAARAVARRPADATHLTVTAACR